MLYRNPLVPPSYAPAVRRGMCLVICASIAVALSVTMAAAQSSPAQSTPQPQTPQQQKPPSTGEAGGPTGDLGRMAIPKKKEEPPPPPPRKQQQEKLPEYTITTDVPLVNLDVLVTTKDGQ